ncbi:SUMF1/EgtB/PvdO family nonheme iron enzyme [bacterium]|nr:SUMF1/EgtB/PvdO family nonheme iron enzyme [bacterium]
MLFDALARRKWGLLIWLAGAAAAEGPAPRDGSQMLWVPPGSYTIGNNQGSSDQKPAHQVRLKGFWIARCEVSNAQFEAYLKATSTPAPPLWQDLALKFGPDRPALGLSQRDALAYCQWAGGSLPSELEWECAARGPQARLYPWGKAFDSTRCCSSVSGSAPAPEAVNSHPEGASWVGCLNMAGNAAEWTESWYQAYSQEASRQSGQFGQKYKVLRGGHWMFQSPDFLTTTARSWSLSVARLPQSGLRLVIRPQ